MGDGERGTGFLGGLGRVQVLEFDPGLGEGLEGPSFAAARERCLAPAVIGGPGPPWATPLSPEAGSSVLGYLVLRGFLVQRVVVAGRQCAEFLLPGDVVRPWPAEADFSDLLVETNWRFTGPGMLALLDAGFIQESATWPSIAGVLAERAARRARTLALRLAVAQLPRLDVRIRVTLWQLADRVGVVDGEGVLIPLSISHRLLGELVSAQRPSVSRTLKQLGESGLVEGTREGFRLRGGPPAELAADLGVVEIGGGL